MAHALRLPNADEQPVLDQLTVRRITDPERPRWDAEVRTHHYLRNVTRFGEHLCYVAESAGQWLAVLGSSAPASAYPVWSGRLQRRPRPMLERLLERCLPP